MIIILVNMFFALSFLVAIILTDATGIKVNGNILLGVTLPPGEIKSAEINNIIKSCKRAIAMLGISFFALIAPFAFIPNYVSIQLSYLLVWILLLLFINNFILKCYSGKIYSLKIEQGWQTGSRNILSIDTEVSRLKNKMPASKIWFTPSLLVSLASVVLAVFNDNSGTYEWSLALAPIIHFSACFIIYAITTRERTVVYSQNSEINFTLNKIYKWQWSKCWIAVSSIGAIILAIAYLQKVYEFGTTLLLIGLISVAAIAIFYTIVKTYNAVREERNKLLALDRPEISLDEDIYWIGGSYKNANDNRSFVEKRIGYGTTVNHASLAGKAISIFLLIAVLLAIIGIYTISKIEFSDIDLRMVDGAITMSAQGYQYSFSTERIVSIQLIEELPSMSKRTGFDGPSLHYGTFNIADYGIGEVYVHLNASPYIMVLLNNGEVVIFNSRDSSDTQVHYNWLINQTKT